MQVHTGQTLGVMSSWASILHASPPVPGVLHLFLQLALQQLLLLALSLGTWDFPNIELDLFKVATVFP